MQAQTALPRKSGNPSRGYYESWLVALEALLEEKNLLGGSDQ
jgi:hypothetical protein